MKAFDSLQSAKRSVNRQSGFRSLGSADLSVAFRAGDSFRIVEFDAFSVGRVQEPEDASELRGIGVTISMSAKQWNLYLRRRKAGKLPSLVGFNLDRNVLKFASPMDRLRFLRVHKTIQMFVDTWARYAG